jgi:hypothetical protein
MNPGRTSREWPLRFVYLWRTGFRVPCRWGAFGLVLGALWLPVAGLTSLIDSHAGRSTGVVFMILIAPIPFYFASRYLLLLGDRDRTTAGSDMHSRPESL